LAREVRLGAVNGGQIATDALWVVADRCMREAGFSGAAPDMVRRTEVSGDYEAAAAANLDSWFGVSAEEWGARFGYHEVPQEAKLKVEQLPGDDLPEAYYDALFGVPGEAEFGTAGGCFGDGEAAVRAGTPPKDELNAIRRELERRVQDLVLVDEGVAAVSAEWSECMAADGYQYADPQEAFGEFAPFSLLDGFPVHSYSSMVASEEEKRVAAADGACKEKVDYWAAVREAEAAADVVVEEEMRSDLEIVLAAHDLMALNSEAIVASK
jgi:hypothetical protein